MLGCGKNVPPPIMSEVFVVEAAVVEGLLLGGALLPNAGLLSPS